MVKHLISGLWIVCLLGTASAAWAQQVDAKLKGLPPAVQKAVVAETRGATIKSVSKEQENGKTIYEVETIVDGRTRDVNVDAAGAVLVVEEQSSLEAIPAAARAAIEKQAAGGRIESVELVKKGGATTYEAVVVKRGKKSEIMVTGDGAPAE